MWKYCGRIFQLGFFILYIIFYSFISFSSTHVSPISLLLFLFLLQNLPATSFALLIKEKRERERQRERRKTGGSAFTMPLEIEVHHALPRPTSHHGSSSSPPSGWVRSTCSFLFFSFFLFSYLLVLIQLYFIRIGICFVFCVWIMWETRSDRLVLFLFSFCFHIYLF